MCAWWSDSDLYYVCRVCIFFVVLVVMGGVEPPPPPAPAPAGWRRGWWRVG